MIIDRKELINFVKKFIQICDKNKIWYALDGNTLLGVKRHGGFLPWHIRFDVMTNIEGYLSLKRLFPNNIIDSCIESKYSLLNFIFLDDKKNWQKTQPFIYIRIAIPTTIKKMKSFLSYKQKILYLIKNKRDNIKNAIDELYEPHYFQGYFLLESRKSKIQNCWIQALTENVKNYLFLDFYVKVPIEIENILKFWYGTNYLKNFKIPKKWKNYISPNKFEYEN